MAIGDEITASTEALLAVRDAIRRAAEEDERASEEAGGGESATGKPTP